MSNNEMVQRFERFPSKRWLAWAGLAAVGGCAVCCSIPFVAALGLGAGVAANVASFIKPGTELVLGGGVFGIVLLSMAMTRSMKRKTNVPKTTAGCGCGPSVLRVYGSPKTGAHEPVACTFDLKDTEAAQAHIDGYRAAFGHLLTAERFPGGFRWTFRVEPGLEEQLKNLAEREHDCCRFFSFDLTRDGQVIVWETRADDDAAAVLEQYFLLPDTLRGELRSSNDIAVLKRSFASAGLAFSSELKPPS